MRKWQEERWQRRYRKEQKNLLDQIILVALIALILVLIIRLPISYALFSAYDQTESVSFRAATFPENIEIQPGKSKTNDSPGNPGPAFNVASIVDGQIYLDFGTYPAGNKRSFPSVLIITNISFRTLSLDWYLTGDLASFFDTQSGFIEMEPNDEYELGLKLNTCVDDLPGNYSGTLIISAMNGFISYEVPAALTLYEEKEIKIDKLEELPDGQAEHGKDSGQENEADDGNEDGDEDGDEDDDGDEDGDEINDINGQDPDESQDQHNIEDDSVVNDEEENEHDPEGEIDEENIDTDSNDPSAHEAKKSEDSEDSVNEDQDKSESGEEDDNSDANDMDKSDAEADEGGETRENDDD